MPLASLLISTTEDTQDRLDYLTAFSQSHSTLKKEPSPFPGIGGLCVEITLIFSTGNTN
jgi:hypothetical protein